MPTISGTLTANGSSDTFMIRGTGIDIQLGGANSTFGSGTIALEISPDGGTNWITDSEYTEAGVHTGSMKQGGLARLTLSGASSPNLDYLVNV